MLSIRKRNLNHYLVPLRVQSRLVLLLAQIQEAARRVLRQARNQLAAEQQRPKSQGWQDWGSAPLSVEYTDAVASQTDEDGKPRPILNLTASFQRPEDGLAHDDVTMPDVTPPEDLRSDMEMRHKLVESAGDKMSEAQRNLVLRPRPIDMRTVDRLHWMNSEPREPRAHSWFRTVAPLPSIEENPALHRAVIAYASDYTLLGTSALPHGLSWMRGELVGASLDHAIWFHRPARADEWLLYATDAPWSGGGRGFNRGRIFNRQGELVASVAQEGMMRRRKGA